MSKELKEVGVDHALADFMPPLTPVQNCDAAFPLIPGMAELRYQLLVRRGQAWGTGKQQFQHAT